MAGPGGKQIPVLGLPSASSVHPQPGRTAQYYLYALTSDEQGWQMQVHVRGYCLEEKVFKPLQERRYSLMRS
jgi:hypothetical protein